MRRLVKLDTSGKKKKKKVIGDFRHWKLGNKTGIRAVSSSWMLSPELRLPSAVRQSLATTVPGSCFTPNPRGAGHRLGAAAGRGLRAAGCGARRGAPRGGGLGAGVLCLVVGSVSRLWPRLFADSVALSEKLRGERAASASPGLAGSQQGRTRILKAASPLGGAGSEGQVSLPLSVNLQYSL